MKFFQSLHIFLKKSSTNHIMSLVFVTTFIAGNSLVASGVYGPNLDYSGQDLSGNSFQYVDFSGGNFTNTSLQGCNLAWGNFTGANLSGANLSLADLRATDFTNAVLTGANFTQAQFDTTTKWPAGFDPLSLDFDGDGVNDYREDQDGTDPEDAASFNPFSQGLVAYYPFDSNLQDQSGYNNDLLLGSASLATGKTGVPATALELSGSGNSSVQSIKNVGISENSAFSVSFLLLSKNEPQWPFGFIIGWGGGDPGEVSHFYYRPYHTAQGFNLHVDENYAGATVQSVPNSLLNRWSHLTYTYDPINRRFDIFLNGVLQTVNYNSFQMALHDLNDSPIMIGAPDSDWQFLVDDVRVYKRTLSPEEVCKLWAREAAAIDFDSDGVVNFREFADGTDPNDPNSFNSLSKGLRAYYPFDANANDESGFERHGEITNATAAHDRRCSANASLHFNGASFVDIPDPVGSNSTGSIALWFKAESWLPALQGQGYPQGPWLVAASGTRALSHGGQEQPGQIGDGDYLNLGAHAGDVGNNNLLFGNFHHWQGWRWANSDRPPSVHEWNSVVATWSGSKLTIFVNGEKRGETETGGLLDFGQSYHPEGLKWNIGASSWSGTGFVGAIDDVRFYDRALNESDVKRLYYHEAFSDTQRTFLEANPTVQGHFSQDEYGANYTNGVSTGTAMVLSDPGSYNLYTNNSIMDINLGGLMIQKQGDSATLHLEIQKTDNLGTTPFAPFENISRSVPMPGNKGFLRVRAILNPN